jgi:hypothetical protein
MYLKMSDSSIPLESLHYGGTVGNVFFSLHIGPSINITVPNGVVPVQNQVIVNNTDGTSQVVGVDKIAFSNDISPHGHYFGNISACN